MSSRILKLYQKAGVKAPKGRGVHTEAFHKMAIAIKKANPSYNLSRCYSITMSNLTRNKAVKKRHWNPQYKSRLSTLRKGAGYA